MDPLTKAAKVFMAELRSFWSPPPGHEAQRGPAVRLVVDRQSRQDAEKTLRLLEWQLDNRHPMVLVDAPVESVEQAAGAIEQAVRRDYEALREGLAEDGVTLAELPPPDGEDVVDADSEPREPGLAIARAAKLVAAAAKLVQGAGDGRLLAGLMVVLWPREVGDEAAYVRCVGALLPLAVRDPEGLRVAVLHHSALEQPPLASSLPASVAFEVDRPALIEFLKTMGQTPADEPPSAKAKPSPKDKAAAEKALGKKIPSEATGAELRALLLEAGSAMSQGSFKVAVKKFRAARMLCRLSGLVVEEAAAGVALGSAALAAQNVEHSIDAFRKAEERAVAAKNDSIAMHARLGLAGAYFAAKRYVEAAAAYGAVASETASMPPIHMEALRMQALSMREQGRLEDAGVTLHALLKYGGGLEPAVQKQTCYEHVAKEHPELADRAAPRPEARPS